MVVNKGGKEITNYSIGSFICRIIAGSLMGFLIVPIIHLKKHHRSSWWNNKGCEQQGGEVSYLHIYDAAVSLQNSLAKALSVMNCSRG